MQSEIEHRERARQIVDFKGIRFGEKEMPTDCDGLIEWHNKAYVFFELKGRGKKIPYGQKLAFERMCDDFSRIKKPEVFIVAEHDVENPEVDIDAAKASVRAFHFFRRQEVKILNKVILLGRLTKDVELKDTVSGKSYARVGLAVDRPFSKNKEVDFFNLVAWDKTAETMSKWFEKGRRLLVEGRLQTNN